MKNVICVVDVFFSNDLFLSFPYGLVGNQLKQDISTFYWTLVRNSFANQFNCDKIEIV